MVESSLLTVPIPGMSLTTEPGSRPWESPPQLVKISEVVSYYADKFTEPALIDSLLEALRQNAPVVDVVNGLMKYSVMQGIHSVDTMMIVSPVVVEMVKTIAELNDVGYVLTAEDKDSMGKVDDKVAKRAIAEVKAAQKEMIEEKPKRSGLMAKGE